MNKLKKDLPKFLEKKNLQQSPQKSKRRHTKFNSLTKEEL